MRERLSGALALAAVLAGGPVAVAQESPLAFVGVTIVPMDQERLLADYTVVIEGGRIVQMGPRARVSVPANARQVDGAGKFLMPGLAEMHAHLPPGPAFSDAAMERVLALYALHGVTTVRGMLGDPRHLPYRDRVGKGTLLSPWIWTTGPSLNGNSVPMVADAIKAVTDQKSAGYDLLKIHPGIQREVFDSLAATAHRVGIPFAGHVPLDVGVRRAIALRYDTIDHLDGYVEGLVGEGSPLTGAQSQWFGLNLTPYLDMTALDALVQATKDAGIWMVPTQSLFENMADNEPVSTMRSRPELAYVAQAEVDRWERQTNQVRGMVGPEVNARFLQARRTILRSLHQAGVRFLLGSDAPQIWNVPGYSVRRELDALVLAGLTPYQALETGTRNVASYLHIDAVAGTVAVGKRADLILLEGNPLADIANVGRQAGVVVHGVWYPKKEVAKRLTTLHLQ